MSFQITYPSLTAADHILLEQYDVPAAPVPADGRCCDAFRRGVFAASLADPTCCMRCWPARRQAQLAERYGWKPASFGRFRRVPPHEARRWRLG